MPEDPFAFGGEHDPSALRRDYVSFRVGSRADGTVFRRDSGSADLQSRRVQSRSPFVQEHHALPALDSFRDERGKRVHGGSVGAGFPLRLPFATTSRFRSEIWRPVRTPSSGSTGRTSDPRSSPPSHSPSRSPRRRRASPARTFSRSRRPRVSRFRSSTPRRSEDFCRRRRSRSTETRSRSINLPSSPIPPFPATFLADGESSRSADCKPGSTPFGSLKAAPYCSDAFIVPPCRAGVPRRRAVETEDNSLL